MSEYRLLVEREALSFVERLDGRVERLCKEALAALADDPYPGSGRGERTRVVVDGGEAFRLRVGGTCTAFYEVLEDDDAVRVLELLPSDEVP